MWSGIEGVCNFGEFRLFVDDVINHFDDLFRKFVHIENRRVSVLTDCMEAVTVLNKKIITLITS